MATTPQRYLDWDGLLNMATSDFLRKDNELSACKNVYCYELGKLEKVPGYSVVGANSQVVDNESVTYLHRYYKVREKEDYLLAFSNSGGALAIKYIAPNLGSPITTWTTINTGTSWNGLGAGQATAINYLNKAFLVGYVSGTTFLPNATLNGTTFSTTDTDITDAGTNYTAMPQGKYITIYRDLLYVCHAYETSVLYPNRIYWCNDPVNMAITWGNLTNFVDIGYNDGDEITGVHELLDRLIIFKHFSMWKWDENESKEISSTGCDSFKSIKKIGNVLYWFNRDGFWRYSGNDPELISAKAQPFIDAINQANLDQVVAVQHNFEYRAFIGTVTIDGITYTNAWFCFDTNREKCYIRCTYHTAKAACKFIESGKERAYFSNEDGYVFKFAKKVDNVYRDGYYNDANPGQEIDAFFVTNSLDHGVPEDTKFTIHMTAFSKNCQGLKVAIDIDNLNEYGEASEQILAKNVDQIEFGASGNRFKYKFYEKSGDKSFEFEGFVLKTQTKEQYE